MSDSLCWYNRCAKASFFCYRLSYDSDHFLPWSMLHTYECNGLQDQDWSNPGKWYSILEKLMLETQADMKSCSDPSPCPAQLQTLLIDCIFLLRIHLERRGDMICCRERNMFEDVKACSTVKWQPGQCENSLYMSIVLFCSIELCHTNNVGKKQENVLFSLYPLIQLLYDNFTQSPTSFGMAIRCCLRWPSHAHEISVSRVCQEALKSTQKHSRDSGANLDALDGRLIESSWRKRYWSCDKSKIAGNQLNKLFVNW